jgi:type I restriction enzyme S subunit
VRARQLELGRIITPAKLKRAGSDDYPVLSMTMRDGLVDQSAKFKKRVASADTSPYKVVKRKQLVVGFPIDEGVLAFQDLYDEAIVSPAYDIWDIQDHSIICCDYLQRFLRSPAALSFYSAKLRGTTARRRTLPDDVFLTLPVPLPPLAEQHRIAEVLDKAEALRVKRRAALAQLDSLTQSLFLDLFGDTREERTRWATVPLEEIVKETKLGLVRGSQEFGPEFEIPYVRMNAITRNGELELGNVQRTHATDAEIESYRLEPGDFLFNTRNSEELVGKTALYRGGGVHLFNNNLMRVRFTAKADPVFVAAAFKTTFVQHELNLRKSGTTNVFAIYYKDLRTLPLPLPPISLQREFARRVAAVEKLKTAQRAALAELDALFASLQHRAFRGEL